MKKIFNPTDHKRLVEQGYDLVAREYARLEDHTEWPRRRWLKKLLNRLKPGSSVLDLGCGSGKPADVEISKKHQITGVDISQMQINLARQNVPNGNFLHGDAGSVAFPPSSFDAVVSFYTLEHIPHKEHKTVLTGNLVAKVGDNVYYQNGWWITSPTEQDRYTVFGWGHLGQYLFIYPDDDMIILRFGKEIG